MQCICILDLGKVLWNRLYIKKPQKCFEIPCCHIMFLWELITSGPCNVRWNIFFLNMIWTFHNSQTNQLITSNIPKSLSLFLQYSVLLIYKVFFYRWAWWRKYQGGISFNTGGSISTSWTWKLIPGKLPFPRTWNNKEMDIF